MKKIRQFALMAATVTALACSGSALGSQMTYEWTGQDDGDGWSGSGTIEITDTDVVAGIDLVPFFDSWEFSWTDGVSTFMTSSSVSSLFGNSDFFVDATGTVTSATVCTGSCSTFTDPIIFATSDSWVANVGFGTIIGGGPSSFALGSNGSNQLPLSTLPLPGTLALTGIGLLVLGIGRRKA